MVQLRLVIVAMEMDILLASVLSSRGFVRLLHVSLILVQGTFPARMDPIASFSIYPAAADTCMTVLLPTMEGQCRRLCQQFPAGMARSASLSTCLGAAGSSMMALWQEWLRRATPPVTAIAAVVWVILPETVLPLLVFVEMLCQVAEDLFVEGDSLEGIIRAQLSATDATKWDTLPESVLSTLACQ